jgi:ATP-dependent Lhr-like helicase
VGRWCSFRSGEPLEKDADALNEMIARQLLQRTGVIFRKTITRERIPVRWAALSRIYRRMELRGEIRGGRFVAGFSGEQFALPQAIELMRKLRRNGPRPMIASVAAADPLNFHGILTPDAPIAPTPAPAEIPVRTDFGELSRAADPTVVVPDPIHPRPGRTPARNVLADYPQPHTHRRVPRRKH